MTSYHPPPNPLPSQGGGVLRLAAHRGPGHGVGLADARIAVLAQGRARCAWRASSPAVPRVRRPGARRMPLHLPATLRPGAVGSRGPRGGFSVLPSLQSRCQPPPRPSRPSAGGAGEGLRLSTASQSAEEVNHNLPWRTPHFQVTRWHGGTSPRFIAWTSAWAVIFVPHRPLVPGWICLRIQATCRSNARLCVHAGTTFRKIQWPGGTSSGRRLSHLTKIRAQKYVLGALLDARILVAGTPALLSIGFSLAI